MIPEELKIYLPKFLSSQSESELFSGLKDFPDNIDSRLYTNHLFDTEIVCQGDGIKEMLVINFPDSKIGEAPGIIISNTCDISESNTRPFDSRIMYAPIINLAKYENAISKGSSKSDEQLKSHLESIRKQRITQIFYLPKNGNQLDESIVFLDRINNTSIKTINTKNLTNTRLFSLSDYGAYLFLLKLSIHFTRIQDKVERKSSK